MPRDEPVADFIAGTVAVIADFCCRNVCRSLCRNVEGDASAGFFRGMWGGDGEVGEGKQAGDIAGDVADFIAGIVAGAIADFVAVFAGGIAGVAASLCIPSEWEMWKGGCEVEAVGMRASPFTRCGRIYLVDYRTYFLFCQGRDVMMDGG